MTTAVGGRCVDLDGVCVAMTGIPSPAWNPGLVVGPSVDAPAAIEWGIRTRREHAIPGGGYDVPVARYPELEQVFTDIGHSVLVSRPMMVVAVDEIVDAPAPAGLELRPVLDERDLEAFRDVQQRGFGTEPEVASASSPWECVRLTESAYVVGWVGDEPVTSALGVTACGAVAVFGVTTVPEHRGNGYGRAVTAATVSAGARMGARLAWLQSSDMGQPVYAAMGFRAVEDYVVWAGADG
jgi:GNAT superfamily N-acetyltransferase